MNISHALKKNLSFWVKGVSFYTNTCKNIKMSEKLLMSFDNEYESAIKISTEHGITCGYVPKTIKNQFANKVDLYDLYVVEKKEFNDAYAIKVSPSVRSNGNLLILDTETTGLPEKKNFNEYHSYKELDKYDSSRIVQLSYILHNLDNGQNSEYDFIIKPDNFEINNSEFHGITQEIAMNDGCNIKSVVEILESVIDENKITYIIGHNVYFDLHVLFSELYRIGHKDLIKKIKKANIFCTMEQSTDILQLEPFRYGNYKHPKLSELCEYVLGYCPGDLHNSLNDVRYTLECFIKLFIELENS